MGKEKKEWEKRRQKKEKGKENEEPNKQDELQEIKENDEDKINEKTESQSENDDIKTVKTEELSLNINKDKDELLIKKNNSGEINIKEIAKDMKKIRKNSQNLFRSKTLMPKDLLNENKIQKNFPKKKKSIKKEEPEEKNKNKFNSFFMICITTIIGYFLKYLLNIFIFEDIEDYEIINIGNIQNNINQGNNEIECGLDYQCFEIFFNDTNLTVTNSPLFESLVSWFLK